MTIPDYDAVALDPLDTEERILERVGSLIGPARRRQLWLLLLDDQGHQLPLLLPCEIPDVPGIDADAAFGAFLRQLLDETGAAWLVVALERPGPSVVEHDDRSWFRSVHRVAAAGGLPLRGQVLCGSRSRRWVALDDLL